MLRRRRLVGAGPDGAVTRVLGVDGGQSGIRMRHSSGERVVEVAGVSRQEGDTISLVAEAIARAWREAAFDPVERVVLGLTTAPVDPAASDRLCGRVGAATGATDVWLADDAVTSHAGALSLGWGVSLLAGTGVACLSLPLRSEPRIIGGHGYLLGDEGGSFWIGSRGVGAVLRAFDGRGTPTTLTHAAERSLGPLADLHVRLHDAERPVDTIARFAPEVMAEAAAGDAVAGAILDEAADELVLVARAGVAWASDDDVAIPLTLGGRLLEPGTELRRRVDDLVARELIHVATRTADASALEGAIKLGQSDDPGPYHALVHTWNQGATA